MNRRRQHGLLAGGEKIDQPAIFGAIVTADNFARVAAIEPRHAFFAAPADNGRWQDGSEDRDQVFAVNIDADQSATARDANAIGAARPCFNLQRRRLALAPLLPSL